MEVGALVGEDDVRREVALESLEEALDLRAVEGKKPSSKFSTSTTGSATPWSSDSALLRASAARSPSPLSTTQQTSDRRSRSIRPRMVPPQPISMSSACAPIASIRMGPASGWPSCSRSISRWPRARRRGGRHPTPATSLGRLVQALEPCLSLKVSIGSPEAVVLLCEQPVLAGEPVNTSLDEVLIGPHLVEELAANEVAADDPDVGVGHVEDGAHRPPPSIETTWKLRLGCTGEAAGTAGRSGRRSSPEGRRRSACRRSWRGTSPRLPGGGGRRADAGRSTRPDRCRPGDVPVVNADPRLMDAALRWKGRSHSPSPRSR